MFLYSIFRSIDLNSYDEEVNNRFLFHEKNSQTNTFSLSNLIKSFIVDNELLYIRNNVQLKPLDWMEKKLT